MRRLKIPRMFSPARLPRKAVLLFIVALLTLAGGIFSRGGMVVSVSDGDSFVFITGGGERLTVRLYGVDAPEYSQPGGREAKKFVSDMILFEHVELSVLDTDAYGRSVALVSAKDGRVLNEELVRAGLAWVYRAYCRLPACARWLILEKEARRAKIGLWKDKKPVYPENWRRRASGVRSNP
ncbi:MAG: thermonuclease family protein [Desulfovibrio sp.]|jgi:endonuclease YncB( thermonuclease family)|nr:thermonuclease family protein [Desulfovibrio sp.]